MDDALTGMVVVSIKPLHTSMNDRRVARQVHYFRTQRDSYVQIQIIAAGNLQIFHYSTNKLDKY